MYKHDGVPFVHQIGSVVSDFPPYLSTVLFTPGCIFRCPFCFNKAIVLDTTGVQLTEQDVFNFLKEANEGSAAKVIDAVCISGGEPLMHTKMLVPFCKRLRAEEYKIKLDTTLCGGELEPLIKYIDGISFSLKADRSNFNLFAKNLKLVNFSTLELKELRLILTKENANEVRELYLALLQDTELFTPKGWKLHIDKAIKAEQYFSEFTELTDEELYALRDTWPSKNKFKKLTF